jgi:hypothetical protein
VPALHDGPANKKPPGGEPHYLRKQSPAISAGAGTAHGAILQNRSAAAALANRRNNYFVSLACDVSPAASKGRRFAAAPGGPGGPCSPLGPAGPGGPTSPLTPCGPAGPCNPASPSASQGQPAQQGDPAARLLPEALQDPSVQPDPVRDCTQWEPKVIVIIGNNRREGISRQLSILDKKKSKVVGALTVCA